MFGVQVAGIGLGAHLVGFLDIEMVGRDELRVISAKLLQFLSETKLLLIEMVIGCS